MYQSFGLLDVFLPKEELAIKIAEIDGIEVDDVNLSVAYENKIFEKFASNSSSPYHQYASLLMKC